MTLECTGETKVGDSCERESCEKDPMFSYVNLDKDIQSKEVSYIKYSPSIRPSIKA